MLQIGRDLDLGEEPLGAEHRGQLGLEDLDRDLAVVFQVLREIPRGHPASPELALDAVAVGEDGGEAVGDVRRQIAVLITRDGLNGGPSKRGVRCTMPAAAPVIAIRTRRPGWKTWAGTRVR